MAAYSDTIRRWAADSRRAGTLADADGVGEVGLGDGEAGRRLAVRFALRIRDGRAEAIRFQVFGCGFTIAACAAAAELAEGRTLQEVAAVTPAAIDAALAGLPRERGYCAILAADALQAALAGTGGGRPVVKTALAQDPDAADQPPMTAADPLYRLLADSPEPPGVPLQDRHLFACLLAGAGREPGAPADNLGLAREELAELLCYYFPHVETGFFGSNTEKRPDCAPALSADPALLALLCSYLPADAEGWAPTPALWLARIIACRATRPGHLWRALGLFSRAELTAAIARHLPALADANSRGMRWKRFLFKQLCDQGGGTMCRSPECGVCSDYALCFGEEAAGGAAP